MSPSESPPVRLAATVMLLRDGESGVQVYVIHRVAHLAFAGGMLAFPGGGVEPIDRAPSRWRAGDRAAMAAQFDCSVADVSAAVATAVRELAEETGVLFADPETGVLAADLLHPWARWVTPAGQPRRYDTFFFAAALPTGAEPVLQTTEADAGEWIEPRAALTAAAAGRLAMLPPTAAVLTSLASAATTADALSVPRRITPVGLHG